MSTMTVDPYLTSRRTPGARALPASPRPGRARSASVRPAARLTARGRAVLLLLLVAVTLVAFSLGRASSVEASKAGAPVAERATYVVQPGETLWGIARRIAPEADTRRTVARIAELNGLGSSMPLAGQRLVLP